MWLAKMGMLVAGAVVDAGLTRIAPRHIMLLTPGAGDMRIENLTYTRRRRPAFPFEPDTRFDFEYDYIRWNDDSEVEDLNRIDIGLMPLIDSPWSRGKCGFKLVQYGAVGSPSIASDVGVNSNIIIDGESGYMIRNDNWLEPWQKLITDDDLRERMGRAARQQIQRHYSVSSNYDKLRKVIESSSRSRKKD